MGIFDEYEKYINMFLSQQSANIFGEGGYAPKPIAEDPIAKQKEDALKDMANWFQRAAVGQVIHNFHLGPVSNERPTGPHPDYTKRSSTSFDLHDDVHGPTFHIKTTVSLSDTAARIAKNWDSLSLQLKTDAFERHALSCAYQILYSVGAKGTFAKVEDCPTCGTKSVIGNTCPEQGSGFVERVGRLPNYDYDKWRLLYCSDRLIRFIKVNDRESYWSSQFKLVIDSAGGIRNGEGGRPYYWRLDPRPWYRK